MHQLANQQPPLLLPMFRKEKTVCGSPCGSDVGTGDLLIEINVRLPLHNMQSLI